MPRSEPLAMRPIERSDDQIIHEWASTPDACRFQPWGPNTWQETQAFTRAAVDAWASKGRRVWLATDSQGSGLGLGELKVVTRSTAEIAYAVNTSRWGHGWGTAIARWLVDRAFRDGSERVQGTCDPRNVASATVMQRVGMTLEGRMRRTLLLRDGWRDSDLYAITRPEWEALRA